MPTELQCLRTQVEELEALAATFTEEGAIQFQTLEAEALKLAKEAVDGNSIPAHSLPLLSGTIRIPGIHVQGGSLSLRFVLPTAYPLQCATLSVECSCSRSLHEELGQVVRRVAADSEGAECLLLAVSELRDAAQTLRPKSGPSLVTESAEPFKDLDSSEYSDAAHRSTGHDVEIVRVVIWFHHIKSLQKRRFIVDRARSLGVTGYSKPGFPGIIICEGTRNETEEYIKDIKGLSWQAMQVRGQSSEALPFQAKKKPNDEGSKCSDERSQHEMFIIDRIRKFKGCFQELSEESSGLSQMGKLCQEAGLEDLFLSGLKISKP